jgi:hypothetical protein
LLLLASMGRAQTAPGQSAESPYAPWAPAPRLAAGMAAQQQPKPPLQEPMPGFRPEMGLNPEQPAPYTIQLDVPPISRVALSVESDAQLKERIRQENRDRRMPERVVFPEDPVISFDTYNGRRWYPMKLEVAPYYVCHGRLHFQQINFERYGWSLGIFQPLVSSGIFLFDFVTWPYALAMEPCRCFEYNTGWCLPGDPVPLLLYPPELSATGFVAEVGTILTLVAVFP